MDLVGFLGQFAIVAAVGVVAAVLMAWIRLPAVAGFLFAGALVGPYALGLVNDSNTISTLAEVGVVLLLFTIGLEFSLTRFARIWNMVVIGGGLQVGLTTIAVLGICRGAGLQLVPGHLHRVRSGPIKYIDRVAKSLAPTRGGCAPWPLHCRRPHFPRFLRCAHDAGRPGAGRELRAAATLVSIWA